MGSVLSTLKNPVVINDPVPIPSDSEDEVETDTSTPTHHNEALDAGPELIELAGVLMPQNEEEEPMSEDDFHSVGGSSVGDTGNPQGDVVTIPRAIYNDFLNQVVKMKKEITALKKEHAKSKKEFSKQLDEIRQVKNGNTVDAHVGGQNPIQASRKGFYKCRFCDKEYPYAAGRTFHEKAIHSRVRNKCKHCPLDFAYLSGVYNHMKKFHPEHLKSAKKNSKKTTRSTNCLIPAPKAGRNGPLSHASGGSGRYQTRSKTAENRRRPGRPCARR